MGASGWGGEEEKLLIGWRCKARAELLRLIREGAIQSNKIPAAASNAHKRALKPDNHPPSAHAAAECAGGDITGKVSRFRGVVV